MRFPKTKLFEINIKTFHKDYSFLVETDYILSEETVLSAANVPRLLAIWQRGVNRNPLAALSQGETPLQQWARNINKGKVRLPLNCRAMTNICWLGKKSCDDAIRVSNILLAAHHLEEGEGYSVNFLRFKIRRKEIRLNPFSGINPCYS